MSAQYPSILRGKKRGVFVVRRHDDAVSLETSEVFGQSQRHSGTTARIRGVGDDVLLQFGHESDARDLQCPRFLRDNSSGSGIKVGSLSICHPSTPFRERPRKDATSRADLRRGTAAESVPSASKVAPALNTLLMEYGQSLRVRIGLADGEEAVARSECLRSVHYALFHWYAVMKGFPFGSGFLQRAHFQQRHQER